MSHNEDEKQEKALKHLFVPSLIKFLLEALVAAILLVVINFAAFESSLLKGYPNDLIFTSYSASLLDIFLTIISQVSFMGQLIVFVIWAVVGMLIYIVVFRIIQTVYGISSSVNTGLNYVKTEHTHGIIHWLSTLHNFFLLSLARFISLILLSVATFLAFVFASQQIKIGLEQVWPVNFITLGLALIATFVGVRLIVIGVCLTMPRFARWYLA